MLSKIFSHIFRPGSSKKLEFDLKARITEADDLRLRGDLHAAIIVYRECIEYDKTNVELINSLGACLVDLGNDDEARENFELAYSLDDAYIPGVVNYAKTLVDKRQTELAMPLLEHAHICEPDFSNIYSIYSAACFARGDAARARHFYLKGWLGNFDSLRMANSYLFPLSYDEADERVTAAEHRFWAETMRGIDLDADLALRKEAEGVDWAGVAALSSRPLDGRKIRIGYWSPDLRNHSVRYFFRPLLENHDKSRFEVFLYHDTFAGDAQTEVMKSAADEFHDVFLLNDVQLYELIRSHQLDILVEMAGHTSANRLTLLKSNRFAPLQVTGVGYPPTTGLLSVDAKILDKYLVGESSSDFYAEKPMVLPSSFWCFDPMGVDEGRQVDVPPVCGKGFVTFACVGNISKINDRLIGLWRQILNEVSGARLLIRSISFEDPVSKQEMIRKLARLDLDVSRVDIENARGGAAYFESYNDIDIILDTFPFNGGTTTCFAAYMGVPIITLAGKSLISRMGLSAMANLGAERCVAHDEASYVEKAVAAARDIDFLRDFRAHARARFRASPLGNGKLFAGHFESACVEMLEQKLAGNFQYESTIPPLPASEMMRRAYAVWGAGNGDASVRILNYCLACYPDHGGAHLFVAQHMAEKGMLTEACDYISLRLLRFSEVDQVAAYISMIRWRIMLGETAEAAKLIQLAQAMAPADKFDAMQVRLYQSLLVAGQSKKEDVGVRCLPIGQCRVTVVIPCDDPDFFDAIVARTKALAAVPVGWQICFVRCATRLRGQAYQRLLVDGGSDVLVIQQHTAEVVSPHFFSRLLSSLSEYDVVGVAGARRWTRLNWRGDKFEEKAAGFLSAPAELSGMIELQCLGTAAGEVSAAQAVLDGVVLGIRVDRISYREFDDELVSVGWALEEDWVRCCGEAGARLAVHRNLGVLIHPAAKAEPSERYAGLLRLQEKYQFPVFVTEPDDSMMVGVPVTDADEGCRVMAAFCFP